MKRIICFCSFLLIATVSFCQDDDLEAMLEAEMGPSKEVVLGTFLSTYVLNNQSVEMLNKNGMNFRISHKFGFLNSGKEGFYGFDYASVYYGLEYAPADWINIGIGRGTFRKSLNGQLKIRLLQQTQGKRNIPFSVVAYGELDYRTNKYSNEDLNQDRTGRIEYTSQLLIARKFGNLFSLQLMPGYTHRNLVDTREDKNGLTSVGIGGTTRLFRQLRFNFEYFWVEEHNTPEEEYYNPLSLGICYQTSRHAFELFATNSTGITSNNHIAYTTGDFLKGDIAIGFNVSIIFSVKR